MTKTGFLRCGVMAALVLVALSLGSATAFAQAEGAEASPAATPVWHYLGAALGLGLIAIGAALGIGKATAAAADGIARQPSAASQITGAVNLPIFLMEGVAILAEVFVLLIILLK
ncbi:MAG: ATP synthase F0 subunit C [Acidobacteriota bacterium]|jgi:F-type H+-transporting ATPase subunit c|nr:ATP synthase F0 subunit C [Acidobacteriota bacterium]